MYLNHIHSFMGSYHWQAHFHKSIRNVTFTLHVVDKPHVENGNSHSVKPHNSLAFMMFTQYDSHSVSSWKQFITKHSHRTGKVSGNLANIWNTAHFNIGIQFGPNVSQKNFNSQCQSRGYGYNVQVQSLKSVFCS